MNVRGKPITSMMISMANAKSGLDMAAVATGCRASEQSGSGFKSVAGRLGLALAQGYLQA